MMRQNPEFTDESIMRISRDVADILRAMAVFARRFERVGLPKGATLSDVGGKLDEVLDELEMRRDLREGEFILRMVAISQHYGFAGHTLSPDLILDYFEDWLENWQRLNKLFQKIGRQDLIDHVMGEDNT